MYYMCLLPLLYCWHSDTYLQNKQKMGSTEKSFLPSLCEIVIQVKADNHPAEWYTATSVYPHPFFIHPVHHGDSA